MEPVYVMESLPFGGDEVETQPLAPTELDLLAGNFHSEKPDIPSAPMAACQLMFLDKLSVNQDYSWMFAPLRYYIYHM